MSARSPHALSLLALALAAGACAEPRAAGPLTHEVYVWQRAWTPAVHDAVRAADPDLAALTVLAAELSWVEGRAQIARVDLPWAALAQRGRPVGLALRVGPVPAADLPRAGDAVAALAADIAAAARAAGLAPRELQLDFDAATARLDAYADWLPAVRAAAPGLPLALTALPDWLASPAFPRLADAVDIYVLQVHSVDRPRSPDALAPLCDPDRARAWIEAAGALGRPFRVALPTYGYRLGFAPSGALLGLSAEAPARPWPPDARVRELRADAPALAALVRALAADRPAALEAIAWYRLPVAGDALTWAPATFAAVRRGAAVAPRLEPALRWPEPTLLELDLTNVGDADAPAPVALALRWSGPAPLAADALAGHSYDDTPRSGARARFLRAAAPLTLAPGDRRPIGWLRFATPPAPETFHVTLSN